MAKYLAAKASWEAANACLQFHGGFGFACEYDVERKFRETRLYQVAPISTNLILVLCGRARARPAEIVLMTERPPAPAGGHHGRRAIEQAVAAPFCTSRLADAGARVIKIERPEPAISPAAMTTWPGASRAISSGSTAARIARRRSSPRRRARRRCAGGLDRSGRCAGPEPRSPARSPGSACARGPAQDASPADLRARSAAMARPDPMPSARPTTC